MAWVSDAVDAVESWLAGQSFWVQIPILLAVLVPVGWLLAGLIDPVVERTLRRHTLREAERHRPAPPTR